MQVQDLNVSADLDNAALASISGGYREVDRKYRGSSISSSRWVYRGETYYAVNRGEHTDKWYSYRKFTRTQTLKQYYTTLWAK